MHRSIYIYNYMAVYWHRSGIRIQKYTICHTSVSSRLVVSVVMVLYLHKSKSIVTLAKRIMYYALHTIHTYGVYISHIIFGCFFFSQNWMSIIEKQKIHHTHSLMKLTVYMNININIFLLCINIIFYLKCKTNKQTIESERSKNMSHKNDRW